MEIRRMWEGGPLRQFSDKREATSWHRYQSPILEGYAGQYVCDDCQEAVVGVYRQKSTGKWLCRACYDSVRPDKTP